MPSLNERKRLRALGRRKEREVRGLFLAEGLRVVRDLLDAGIPVEHALYTDEAAGHPEGALLVDRLLAGAARCERVEPRELDEFAGTVTPQGLLVVARVPDWGWEDLRTLRLLVLDGVQDPGNLGTLVRAAEVLGAGGVLALEGTTDPWGAKAVRAAAGSSFRLPVLVLGRGEAIAGLRARGVPVWVAAADGEPVRRDGSRPAAVALVIGNEGAGVSEEMRAAADRVVAIEQRGGAESLNAAVAGALLMDRMFGGDGARID